MSLFETLLTIAAVAIPIVIVVKIARRVRQVTRRLSDPTRLQRVFAESAAAALRRAGADPKAIAKLEVLGMGEPGVRSEVELRAAVQQARAALRKSDAAAPAMPRSPVARLETELRSPPRPRQHHRAQASHRVGLDMGDRFRLSEPPELNEPHRALRFSANWIAAAALAGAAAYYLMR